MKAIGLMSGTSVDGIDAAWCEIEGSGATLRAKVHHFQCFKWETSLRGRILQACENRADGREIALLNVAVGEAFARAAQTLIEKHGAVDFIGSHGQTIGHFPADGASFQIGESAVIAARTGTQVVSDFRARDLAEGGQGAPLVPYVDWVLLRSQTANRVVLNLGGIANCTLLPANCELNQVRAWDTGPANMVIDECARALFGVPFDKNGELAAQGNSASWFFGDLNRLHPFFAQKPPKSAGREEFGAHFAAGFHTLNRDPHDIIAEVTWISAYSVAESLKSADFPPDFELIVGGGGAFNATLMGMLQTELPHAKIRRHEDFGIPSDAKEALAFAILAHETLRGVKTSVPTVTGAWQSAILGKITPA